MNLEERRDAIIDRLKNGEKFLLRNCSLCDYPLAYQMINNKLYYDSGCDCVNYSKLNECNLEGLDFYLKQDTIAKKWGLEE